VSPITVVYVALATASFVLIVFLMPYVLRYTPVEHLILCAAAVERAAFRVRSAAQCRRRKESDAEAG
jgi:hypothetical protein